MGFNDKECKLDGVVKKVEKFKYCGIMQMDIRVF